MIDMGSGPVFPVAEVPDHLPRLRRGRKIHKSTPYRWAKHGIAGIKLKTICVGGTLCTDTGSLREFFERLTALRAPGGAAPAEQTKASPRMPREDVEKRLEEIGL